MYEIEYKWTKNEIVVTTTNISEVTESNKNPQSTCSVSRLSQVNRVKWTKPLETPTSKRENQANKVVKNISKKAIIEEPCRPKNRPNKLISKKDKSGKYKTNRYI